MRIKRLEITGFKSFMERSVFSFDDGITGVVGPNGCGKSNVVDAIRWVMGEQSAKNLRGRGMEDVIFNGSESKPPLSMAEVSLTFKVEEADALAPQYAGFPEITVTRRLFRSGDSEYLINKAACRLHGRRMTVQSEPFEPVGLQLIDQRPARRLQLEVPALGRGHRQLQLADVRKALDDSRVDDGDDFTRPQHGDFIGERLQCVGAFVLSRRELAG